MRKKRTCWAVMNSSVSDCRMVLNPRESTDIAFCGEKVENVELLFYGTHPSAGALGVVGRVQTSRRCIVEEGIISAQVSKR